MRQMPPLAVAKSHALLGVLCPGMAGTETMAWAAPAEAMCSGSFEFA